VPESIETPVGLARVTWIDPATAPSATLLLGHGAGGGIGAADLQAVAAAGAAAGLRVGLVEQPYRVAGKRAPVPAPTLDTAFEAVIEAVEAILPPKEEFPYTIRIVSDFFEVVVVAV